MTFMDKLGDGLEQAVREVEKALDKGKTKVGELQLEMQMDGLAKKLGYLVFDFYRGRPVDQAVRQKVLDELSRLEDELHRIRAEAAARAEAEAQARAARKAQSETGDQEYGSTAKTGWEETPPPQGWDGGSSPEQSDTGGEDLRPPNP